MFADVRLLVHGFAAKAPKLATLVGCCAAVGCADAASRFRQFEDRRIELAAGGTPDGGPNDVAGTTGSDVDCQPPAPGVVHGPALLAIETTTTPGAAILFFGQVETPELDGATAVKFSYRALDASDRRTEVGDALIVGPYAIGKDGSFEAPTALSTLPGSANALLPGVDITSQLTLHGTICGVSSFYCGTVTGTITAPIQGPATGQFGLQLLGGIDEVPDRPRFGCADDALARPLADEEP
jgi:hypothetical protein